MIKLNIPDTLAVNPFPRDIGEKVIKALNKSQEGQEGQEVEVQLMSPYLTDWFATATYIDGETGKETKGRPYELFMGLLKKEGYKVNNLEFRGETDSVHFKARKK